ncbi:hypothetical protein SUGI_0965540 [Cryptomeria japonica]|nr:hypothetical protein SUGI_0965540 [Cryptomeria japonica]
MSNKQLLIEKAVEDLCKEAFSQHLQHLLFPSFFRNLKMHSELVQANRDALMDVDTKIVVVYVYAPLTFPHSSYMETRAFIIEMSDQPVVDLYLPMWAKHQHLANKSAFKAGLVSVPMLPPHPSFSSQEDCRKLVRILQETQPKAAIAYPAYISRVIKKNDANEMGTLLKKMQWISLVSLFKANPQEKLLTNGGGERKYSGCKAEDLFLIQYTYGATGSPKPIMITAGYVAHNVRAARKAYDYEPWSVIVSWLPQYHDCGLMFLLLTIVCAATYILTSPFMFIKRPILWLEMWHHFGFLNVLSCRSFKYFSIYRL